MTRQVTPETLWRVARVTLGRMACVYGDPARDGHDHGECVRDDESYAADQVLGLIAAAVKGDDSVTLDRVTDLLDTVKRPELTPRR